VTLEDTNEWGIYHVRYPLKCCFSQKDIMRLKHVFYPLSYSSDSFGVMWKSYDNSLRYLLVYK